MFYVEKYTNTVIGWFKIPFTESRARSYCEGFVDAIDSMYPSSPMRIIKKNKDGTTEVVRETKGRGEIHLN